LRREKLDCNVILSADNRHEGGFLKYLEESPSLLSAVERCADTLREEGFVVSCDDPFITYAFAAKYGIDSVKVRIPVPETCLLESGDLKPVVNVQRGHVTPCVVRNLERPRLDRCKNTPVTCGKWFLPEVMIYCLHRYNQSNKLP